MLFIRNIFNQHCAPDLWNRSIAVALFIYLSLGSCLKVKNNRDRQSWGIREPYGLLMVLPWRPPLESFHPHCVMKYIHQSGKRIEHVPWSKCSLHHRSVRNDRTLLFHRSIVPIGFISSSYLFIQSCLHIKNPTIILNLLRN